MPTIVVMQFGAALSDLEAKLPDRLAVDVRQAGGGAYADAFAEGRDDLDLLFAGQDVHGRSLS
jgi:hypothetical protein